MATFCPKLSMYPEHIFDISDVDECATNDGGCAQTCTNTDGSFTCSCLDGYTSTDSGVTCTGMK